MPEKAVFGLFFFQNFLCDVQNLAKTGSFKRSGRDWKINLVDLKKDPAHRENPRSAPDFMAKNAVPL